MQEASSPLTNALTFIVRLLGVAMLLIVLFVGIKVILEAWALYQEPQKIERFAKAIEQGSNLDSMLASFSQKASGNEDSEISSPTPSQNENLSVTYFMAWFVAILLLMVIGGLAMSAIRTGGQLALYDLQVKRFARLLMHEVQSQRPRHNAIRERDYE